MFKKNKSLKSKIIFNTIFLGVIIISIAYVTMLYAHTEISKESSQEKLQREIEILTQHPNSYHQFDLEQNLLFLASKDKYIANINFNNKTIYNKNEEISFSKKFKIHENNIYISYSQQAINDEVNPLQQKILFISIAFLIMLYVISYQISKLFNPFSEIVNFANNFNINSPSFIEYKNKNVANDFNRIKKSFNYIIESLMEHSLKVKEVAVTDSLTKLHNRLALEKTLLTKFALKEKFAMLFLDLDGFKKVNDTLGHKNGDMVLKKTTTILNRVIKDNDNIYRLGGDEFIIIINYQDINEIKETSNQILSNIESYIFFPQYPDIKITTSIGISLFPENGNDQSELLKKADMAMYKSKEFGKNQYMLFENYMEKEANDKFELEHELKRAIENKEFILHFQPQYDIERNSFFSAETLIRWEHPEKGLLYPDYFIDFLEHSYYMIEVGNIVLEKSCEAIVKLKKENYQIDKLSINISSKQFENKDFYKDVVIILNKTGCKPNWIEFEITERLLMTKGESVINVLNQFRKLGITIAIDDFGTGYSSLSIIKTLPIDKLKIDKSFVDSIEDGIAELVIKLSEKLQVKVIAEGVETTAQKLELSKLNCKCMQGYLFSKPIPFDDFKDALFLQNNLAIKKPKYFLKNKKNHQIVDAKGS